MLSWACRLREPDSDAELFGRVKVAAGLRPWLPIREETPAGSHWFVSVTELVRYHLTDLFAGLQTSHHTLFRITRDAEVEWADDGASGSLREAVAERVRLRRYEPVVRIEFGPDADPTVRDILLALVELTEQETYDRPADDRVSAAVLVLTGEPLDETAAGGRGAKALAPGRAARRRAAAPRQGPGSG